MASLLAHRVSYIFEDLLNLWGDKLCVFLRNGDPAKDGSVASSVAQVFERSSIDRSFAVTALIAGMYKYNNKFRFIGALGKIGTEEAIEELLNFLGQTIEHSNDPEIRKRLIKALGNHTEKVHFLLQNLPSDGQYSIENKIKTQQELQELNQGKNYTLEEMREILTVTDKNGKPSDHQSIVEVAEWLQYNGASNALVQEHLPEIIEMLEVVFANHKTHYAREATVFALANISGYQTFKLIIRRLENKEEKYENTVEKILLSLRHFADRDMIDLSFELVSKQTFETIQSSYPGLTEAVMNVANYVQQYFKKRKQHE